MITNSTDYEDYCSDTLRIWKNVSVFSSYIRSATVADNVYVKDSRLGQQILLNKDVRVLGCDIGDMTQIGFASKLFYTSIGKYCSISWDVSIGGPDHRFDNVTSYTWGTVEELCRNTECHIGNDVWIGYDAVIMAGVKIGDGAIIGTRAVVTKDVEPYSIVGGVPAKEIRKRFAPEVIEKIKSLQWWNWPEEKIQKSLTAIQSGDIDSLERVV